MRFKTFVKVIRAPFFASLAMSVLVGTAVAWGDGYLHWGYLLLTLIGIVCTNAGLNMSNDYFDHLSGNDEANQELTPFSGGSRTIQEGILAPGQVLLGSALFFLIAIIIGLYLTFSRGWLVLWLGLAGIFLAIFTSAPPFKMNYVGHGLGELATFIGAGPLIVVGAYFVQAQQVTLGAVWASVPVGLLGAALIWINEFPDYQADAAVGKSTLVVVLGKKRAVWGYVALLTCCYASILAGSALSLLPYASLLAFLTVPLAHKSVRGALQYHSDTAKLIPSNAAAIQIYLGIGFLLCVGYAVARVF